MWRLRTRTGNRSAGVAGADAGAFLSLLDTRLGDGPLTDGAETELLAEVLDIPLETAMALPPDQTRRALARLEQLVGRLLNAAAVDQQTGCLQREAGLAALDREVDRVRRLGGGMVIAVVSLDGLMQMTRKQGKDAGNAVLAATGRALQERFRGYDLLVRRREDEFVCGLVGADLTSVHERLVDLGRGLGVSASAGSDWAVSVGVTELREGDTLSGLLSRANADLAVDQRRRRRG